ncbi:Crp/Fnr family transcriptional regulator [Bacillus mesophilum]|uniref:Crp/Fnr family transcriptional regulator n=1 Tax=Bacillus mesophilum TaxID=1071718 RepID=A0A7V7RJV1_9BACI|nr:Crp/Fnr family transcriptional regulator [Bacillus mesophilum]KAB2331281.1 Crp/Fnr family transcriptional regulator [Bacillus mesophilum]
MKELLLKYMDQYTSLAEAEQQAVINDIVIESFSKGANLLKQGDKANKQCFFVLEGCVRQYYLDIEGNEITANFYTEEQAILLSSPNEVDRYSRYTYTCLEDCVLVVADLDSEQEMYAKYSELAVMTRRMMEKDLRAAQNEFTAFIQSSPEERYKMVLRNRPDLIKRVPQYQFASYLGITPESLSRIKKRLHNESS